MRRAGSRIRQRFPCRRPATDVRGLGDEAVTRAIGERFRIHRIRRQLVVLRRVGRPQHEALSALLRDKSRFVSDETRSYLRDTHDHFAQIMELVDSSREMALGLTEIYLSQVSHRTNEIMKVLTLMASIFIPLTFIAGIYGMNFESMPELQAARGYPMVLGAMLAVALAMVAYFWHRGWLGRPRRRGRAKPDPRQRRRSNQLGAPFVQAGPSPQLRRVRRSLCAGSCAASASA